MEILQILSMYHPDGEKILNDHAKVIKTNNGNPKNIIDILTNNQIDGIVLRAPVKIDAEIINATSTVKAISSAGVGFDNIDVDAATKKGIAVLHAPKLNSTATAEHAVSLIFALSKNLLSFHHEMEKGNYGYREKIFSHELIGKQLGLIGFGSIAQRVAKICGKGLGMKIVCYVRHIDEEKEKKATELGIQLTTSIEEIFINSDTVSVHIPLTKYTSGIIDGRMLRLMKPSAFFINTARGAIVNENDLYDILAQGKIAGAGLDVYLKEPPEQDNPLLKLKNVILTPHIGGITEEAAKMSSSAIAANMIAYLKGDKPDYIANPEVLER